MKKLFVVIIIVFMLGFIPAALAQENSNVGASSEFESVTNMPKSGVRVILPEEETLPSNTTQEQSNSTVLYMLAAAFLLVIAIVAGMTFYSNARPKPREHDNQKL